MQEAESLNSDGLVKFISLFKLSDLERVLLPYKNSEQYDAVIRYYFACVGMPESRRLLEPLGLLKQTLAGFLGNRRTRRSLDVRTSGPIGTGPDLPQIYSRIESHEARLQFSAEQMKQVATEVPRTLNFTWLGGGLGGIQRDYLNVWKQVLAPQGYTLNLWYDSDALLAWQTNKLIVESAKADVFLQGVEDTISETELGAAYERRAVVLKQQMYAHINKAVASGESADEARIDLLVRAYGQDAVELREQLERNRRSVLDMSDFELRDLAAGAISLQLQDIYEREMRLSGNMAAASDVVRAEVLFAEGGSHTDIDHLPPLSNTLGTVDISGFDREARLGLLQLLLNNNPEWMPGRQASSHYYGGIPTEYFPALETFAKSRPRLGEVFEAPEQRLARPFALRALAMEQALSNAFLMAHPGAEILQTVIDRFRSNYELIDASMRLAAQRGVSSSDVAAMLDVAEEVFEKTYGPLSELPMEQVPAAIALVTAVATHFGDGIRLESEGTIHLTGPGAMRDGMVDYAKAHLSAEAAATLRKEAAIAPNRTVNGATEEEQDHSWKANGNDAEKWVREERARWREGQYKARYSGDIAHLLKQSTVEFQQGWPLIEGRAVLLTDVLERLAEGLGEPFIEAMRQGHDGEIRFDKPLPLSFDDRQLIKSQSPDALVPVFLSDEKIRDQGIDEVLSDIASGARRFIEASPLQRLSLGLLLGMDSLDNPHFNAATSELENLANGVAEQGVSGRYAAIERQLYKRKAARFMSGLGGDPAYASMPSDSALELKKTALKEARTLFQWGRQVARIQKVAALEHRIEVIERSGQLLDGFGHNGVQMVPQDLLLNRDGEAIGGRCYPLALVMSAALAQGDSASGLLRERFFLAVLEPEQDDSQGFLHALEALRDVPMSDVGTSLGQANLDRVTAALEKHIGPRTLLLNSDNHSMLVAKTVSAERSLYHFFDPNFGLCKFEGPEAFLRGLEHFFQKEGMARYYAAYGSENRPEFDLIDLQNEKVSALQLSDGFTVEHLLQPGALPGQSQRPMRQRLASARGQSLQNNPRLGSCLLALDGHWWSRQIEQATSRLQQENQLAAHLVPLFDTLEVTPDGAYRVSLIDPVNPEQLVRVVTDDHRLLRIKSYLSEQFSALANKPFVPSDPTEVGSVHTLNAGFAIQALMNALRSQEGSGRPLTLAVRLHAYVNYAQLAHGNVVDIAGLVGLVRQALVEEKLIARTVAPVVKAAVGSSMSEATGGLLQLANVGFDIYQLSTAHNDVERAQFGTQLAFDSASLVLSVGAYAVGATTAGAVLGGAAVILGGLAVGVGALAQGFAIVAEEAKEVGLLFDEIAKAHLQAYRFDARQGAWLPRSSLIVQTLDLTRGALMLDSPKLYPQRDHFGVPTIELDYDRAINIRRDLGLPGQVAFKPPAGQVIVLPCTPQTCYRYEYIALPFATSRHDTGFDTARRLEKRKADGSWQFQFSFYSFPSEYIVRRMVPDYRQTVIDVVLDSADRSLVVPLIPPIWHNMIAYKIQGAGKRCALVIHPGVRLSLESTSLQVSTWFMDASWASEQEIRIESYDKFFIDDVQVTIVGGWRHEISLRLADNQIFKVDLTNRTLVLLELDAPPDMDQQTLQDHFKALARDHRLAMAYTPISHHLIPFEDPDEPRRITAWYDAKEDRFLYIRDDLPGAGEALLGAVVGSACYFYNPQTLIIWQVDALTGLLSHRYWLRSTSNLVSTIKSIEADAQGVIHVVQQVTRADQTVDVLRYVIHDGQLLLSSNTRELDLVMEPALSASETLADWSQVLGDSLPLTPNTNPEDTFVTVNWQPAPFVSICWKSDAQWRDMAWVRRSDRLIIRPAPRRNQPRGWPDSIKNMTDLTLLAPPDDSDVFVIYDRLKQELCSRRRTLVEGKGHWSNRWTNTPSLENVIAVDGGYVALTSGGVFYNLSGQGDLALAGVREQWFKGRAQWWSELDTLAQRHGSKSLVLIGLTNVSGDERLCAWYVGNRLLLADLGSATELRLLGATPDSEAAWLFDVASGEIYRQGFIDPQTLDAAFGEGSQLLQSEALPQPQREWAPWQFGELTVEGAGLRGVTLDGVVVVLRDGEPARITGVTREWVATQGGREIDGLRQLVARVPHSPLLSVEESGSLKWFVTGTERVIRVPKAAIPESFDVLGTQRQTNVLLHESSNGRLLALPDTGLGGPLSYVQRDGEVLVVESQESKVDDLVALMPDDVRVLVLRMGQGAVSYRLSRTAWLRIKSVVLDCRPPLGGPVTVPGKLVWELDEPDELLLSRVQEHLVILDPNSGHSLILRQVYAADVTLRGDVLLSFGEHRHYAVSTLVERLSALQDVSNGVTLQALLEVSPEVETNSVD
ncbi:putative toxin protein [Pseudomonas fluorescens Q2-87]|uniref:Putative toxin protein n=1 Tax=Pseudomonas fluorescens (strain Q2-87) TaxID=1038922 RepID=J2F4M7_PSEFQ|nr:TcdA/TcdB pore-forming domain-containing protein [Pseudomonas fluorescens]EJL03988.1 putative toxin protein [Pseudomonas fluorescens Q2-87]